MQETNILNSFFRGIWSYICWEYDIIKNSCYVFIYLGFTVSKLITFNIYSKNLGTSISPWVVSMEALKPFSVENYPQDPQPFPYLRHQDKYTFNVDLTVSIKPKSGENTVGSWIYNYYSICFSLQNLYVL